MKSMHTLNVEFQDILGTVWKHVVFAVFFWPVDILKNLRKQTCGDANSYRTGTCNIVNFSKWFSHTDRLLSEAR